MRAPRASKPKLSVSPGAGSPSRTRLQHEGNVGRVESSDGNRGFETVSRSPSRLTSIAECVTQGLTAREEARPARRTPRLLTAYTMVFWIEFRVSVASSRAISRIAALAILQIALPTELPRRDPHFTQKLASQISANQSNGLEHHLEHREQWFANRSVRDSSDHCSTN